MKNNNKTREQLLKDLEKSKKRIAELEKPEVERLSSEQAGKQSEKKLKESEERIRNILENSTNLFYSHTPDHILTYLSPQVKDILGYTHEEALIKWTELASDNPINEIGFKHTVKAIETGKPQPPYELELIHKSGKKVWAEVREAPVVKDGKTISIVGALTDITERKLTEAALKASEMKYRALLDNINDLVMEMDSEGKFTYVSPQIFDMFGYTQKESIGLNAMDFVHPDDIEKCIKAMETLDEMKHLEYRSRHKDGHYVYVSTSGRYVPDSVGGFKVVSVLRDITERVRAEEALRTSEAILDAFFRESPVSMNLIDDQLRYVKINCLAQQGIGLSLEEIVGKPIYEVVPKFSGGIVQGFRKILETGQPELGIEVSGELPSKQGVTTHWLSYHFPITMPDGRIWGIGVIANEITKRKQAEEELAKHREHLEELVRERTKELEEKNKELKHFNELFVGREFRIKELKDKVKELSRRDPFGGGEE